MINPKDQSLWKVKMAKVFEKAHHDESNETFGRILNVHIRVSNSLKVNMSPRFSVSYFDGTKRHQCKMAWNDLENAVDFLDNKLKFERTSAIQKRYDTFLEYLNKSSINVAEHIIKCELPIDGINSVGIENKITLSKNRYPYDFGDHSHYLLWIHPDCDQKTKTNIFEKSSCHKIIFDLVHTNKSIENLNKKFIIFRNNPTNKSVQAIEHFHVIFY
jgi:hypothetical protein